MSGQPITLFAPPRRRLRRCRLFVRRYPAVVYAAAAAGLSTGILVAVINLW